MQYDAIIIGGGACGLMCASQAGLLGKNVLLIEGNSRLGAKILISGGGRCNFTNLYTSESNFVGEDPSFVSHALARWQVEDTVDFFEAGGIYGQEKTLGQLFPKKAKAKDVVGVFEELLKKTGQNYLLNTKATDISKQGDLYTVLVESDGRESSFTAPKVVLATGGLPIAKLGASDFSLRMARLFGHSIVPTAPALVPLTITGNRSEWYTMLSGISHYCKVSNKRIAFRENILFTHWGLSGPAILQISTYWRPGEEIVLDLLPDSNFNELIAMERENGGRQTVAQLLKPFFSKKLLQALNELLPLEIKVASLGKKQAKEIGDALHKFTVLPAGDKGYQKAEVMRGGVSTSEINNKTLESKFSKGLYLGGECVDITGWLGGYNFQWAWAAGYVIAQEI